MKIYTNSAVDFTVDRYIARGGEIAIIEEGCLASYGLAILWGEGLKTCIIKEKYLNAWSSGSVMKFYNKIPKKYDKMLIEWENRDLD